MKKNLSINLNRGEKILLFLYEFSKKTKKRFSYEDIVVGLFKKHPKDFHLKGYRQYPDSSDSTQRTLYEFKKKGFVNASNKIFTLTENGIDFAEKLKNRTKGHTIDATDRFSRNAIAEISRIKLLEGFSLFVSNEQNRISENDLYSYLGITVRTSKSIFMGRIKSIKSMIQELRKNKEDELYTKIIQYHKFLFSKYQQTIKYFLGK
jgi:hypothetical protein